METLVGVHHFYGGMGLALLGYLMVARCRRRAAIACGLIVVIGGALVMADDIWQHAVQHARHGPYDSPCKCVYKRLSPCCPFLSRTVAAADRLFRRVDATGAKADK